MGEKTLVVFGIVILVVIVELLRSRSFQHGRLAGMREAATQLSRTCSSHYERGDEPLPEKVEKAIDYMAGALRRGGLNNKIDSYRSGLSLFGDAMGEAAWNKGFDAGRGWMEPSDGEKRIDLTPREIRDLAYLAHYGFERAISDVDYRGFKSAADAGHASEAIRRLESKQPPIIPDDPYAFAFNRQTMIWDRFRATPKP